jgi:diguanylate cyclase
VPHASDPAARPRRARLARQRGVLLASGGLALALLVAAAGGLMGVASTTSSQWLLAAGVTAVAQGALFLMARHGYERHLGWDPHFVLVPVVYAALLLSLYVYIAPELRLLVLMGWSVILLFPAGLIGFREVAALSGVMATGYVAAVLLRAPETAALGSTAHEVVPVAVFIAVMLFAGTVFERLRSQRQAMIGLRRQLATEALTDALTGLPNRRHLDRALELELERTRRYDTPVSLALLDVDHFKNYNDTVGHPAGDEVLRAMAEAMGGELRTSDLLARYGGEEFALIMPGIGPEDATRAAERLRTMMASHPFPFGEVQPGGRLTLSAGVASSPAHGETASELLRRADDALYQAKREGRNRVVVAASDEAPALAS